MPGSSMRTAGRLGIGIVCLAASAALAGAAVLVPIPHFGPAPAGVSVTPAPAAAVDVCPGPLVSAGADGKAGAVRAAGRPQITAGTLHRRAGQSPLRGADGGRSATDSPVAVTAAAPEAASGHDPAARQRRAEQSLAAAQSRQADTAGLSGLAAAACGPATGDSWIIAGSTTLGQDTLLLLANPAAEAVSVTVSVWDLRGPVAGQAGAVSVPARSQRVLPVSGLAPDKAVLALHVQADGAGIAAAVQQSFVQGLTPRGTALAGPGAPPGTHQVIPGMLVRTLGALQNGQASDDYGVDLPAVRILNPSEHTAHVTVGVVGEKGTSAGNAYSASVGAAEVTEIPLEGLADGDYTVTVTSTVPVAAAARTAIDGAEHTTGAGAAKSAARTQDFAWFAAARPLPAAAPVAVAPGPAARLHLVNPGEHPAEVTLTAPKQAAATQAARLAVPAGGAASIPVSAGLHVISGPSGLLASVGYDATGQLASYPVAPPAHDDAPVLVYTR